MYEGNLFYLQTIFKLTQAKRERATHTKPMPRRKERVSPVKPWTSPRPMALSSCLKLVVVAAWSSSLPLLCSSSAPPLDLIAATSKSTPLDRISISFSIYLSLSLSLSLFLPPSFSFTKFESLTIGFILIFVSLSLYIEIFNYKICLEVEKMWEKYRKIAFSECYQTPENIFQYNF